MEYFKVSIYSSPLFCALSLCTILLPSGKWLLTTGICLTYKNKNAPCPLGFSAQIKNSVAKVQRKNELSKKVSLYFPRLWGFLALCGLISLAVGSCQGGGGSVATGAQRSCSLPCWGNVCSHRLFGLHLISFSLSTRKTSIRLLRWGAFSNVKIPKWLCEKTAFSISLSILEN